MGEEQSKTRELGKSGYVDARPVITDKRKRKKLKKVRFEKYNEVDEQDIERERRKKEQELQKKGLLDFILDPIDEKQIWEEHKKDQEDDIMTALMYTLIIALTVVFVFIGLIAFMERFM